MALFKLKLAEGVQGRTLIGFDEITVLAVVPWAMAKPDGRRDSWGPWCKGVMYNEYICLADGKPVRIGERDIWPEVERGIYLLEDA